MATLTDLTPGFLSLTPKERFELIREIRALRRTPTENPTTKRKTKTKSVPRGKISVDNLTQEQAQQLLALLGETSED